MAGAHSRPCVGGHNVKSRMVTLTPMIEYRFSNRSVENPVSDDFRQGRGLSQTGPNRDRGAIRIRH